MTRPNGPDVVFGKYFALLHVLPIFMPEDDPDVVAAFGLSDELEQ